MSKKAIIIGGGIGGLGTACLLSKAGYTVELFEKNEQLGGRASVFSAKGYTFDMGPSWYLMPDLFAHFFELLGERVEDHLNLQKLSPSYRIFSKANTQPIDIYSDLNRDLPTFEALEAGSGPKLKAYLRSAGVQYELAKEKFIFKNYDSFLDFFTIDILTQGWKMNVFQSMDRYVSSKFKSDAIRKILQYTLVFLGSSPYNTPALYNIMSHIDFSMGVFYPQGGIYELIRVLTNLAEKHGASLRVDSPVQRIILKDGKTTGIELVDGTIHEADLVISNADIHFTEQRLLPPEAREFSEDYWSTRVLAPSAFILYLGVNGRIPSLSHHNLVFSADWKQNFAEIFDTPTWPTDASLYVCAPSVTDPSVAPADKENLFVLVPIASGLKTTPESLAMYRDKILLLMEQTMDIPHLRERIEYERIFCVQDFTDRYHSYKGSALGLAHTLTQTAIFRPNNISKKIRNLYYVGASTNPGIGMPMCLASAELVFKRITGDRSATPLKTLTRVEG